MLSLPTLLGKTLPCFPCINDEHKSPMTPHGFKNATTDIHRFTALCKGRNNFLIGVPTGEVSGFDVLDIDPTGIKWAANQDLPITRTHKTRRGTHYLFMHILGIRNSASKIAPGVDIRGDGGYMIWWPSVGLEVQHENILANWPPIIYDLLKSNNKPSLAMGTPDFRPIPNRIWISFKECQRLLANERPGEAEIVFLISQGCPSKEGWSFLEHPYMGKTVKTFDRESLFALQSAAQALSELSHTEVGSRNQTLNSCAFSLGRLLARGWIRFDVVVRALWRGAVNSGLVESDGPQPAISTIRSGIIAGLNKPYPNLEESAQ